MPSGIMDYEKPRYEKSVKPIVPEGAICGEEFPAY
jgi:hypothetical protein